TTATTAGTGASSPTIISAARHFSSGSTGTTSAASPSDASAAVSGDGTQDAQSTSATRPHHDGISCHRRGRGVGGDDRVSHGAAVHRVLHRQENHGQDAGGFEG